jgi:hypothetical protein
MWLEHGEVEIKWIEECGDIASTNSLEASISSDEIAH